MNIDQIAEMKNNLMPALNSKEFEFKMMGYKDISTDDIWECLFEKVWKTKQEFTLHQVVQDILHLPIHTYMSYLTLSAYHIDNDDLMMSIQAVTKNEIN